MAKRKSADGPNKSEFIREQLKADPSMKPPAVAEAWTAAGHPGVLTPTLYYQVKRSMGLSKSRKKRRGGKRAAAVEMADVVEAPAPKAPKATKATVVVTEAVGSYLEIEAALDSLVGKSESLRDGKLSEALRAARRHASTKLV